MSSNPLAYVRRSFYAQNPAVSWKPWRIHKNILCFSYVECGDWKLQVKKTCDMQVALGTPPQVLVEISTSKCESVLQLFSQTHSKTDANYMINAGLGALHLFSFQMFVQGTR